MTITMMPLIKCLTLLGLLTGALAEPKVVHMPMTRNRNVNNLWKRAATVNVTVVNDVFDGLYFVNATVGTPPQLVQLQIDTGSSDVWFFGPQSCDVSASPCLGGYFDPHNSSSVSILNQGGFRIQYGTPNSGVIGNYISDVFSVNGATVKNMTMAVATQAQVVPTGIMGIGFDLDESIAARNGTTYPNFVDLLVTQGLINTRAYSLWLNDINSDSGNVLFGGYDADKFTGKLLTLPIQPDVQTNTIATMTVAWTSLNVTTGNGSESLTANNFTSAALLDSGTTLTLLPENLYVELANFFQAVDDGSGNAYVDCGLLQSATGSLDFGFGGSGGPVIKVPFGQFALPAYDQQGYPLTFKNGKEACVLGIQPQTQSGLGVIFGDTFLRSAYVVYDLDNKQISIAQTVFNSSQSNVVEIQKSNSGNGFNGGSVISGVTVTQTATGAIAPGLKPTGTATGGTPVAPTITGLSLTGSLNGSALASSTATATGSASGSRQPGAAIPGLFMSALVVGFSLFLGTAFVGLH